MKRCPTCQSTYTDDSLSFCLQDGALLLGESEEHLTPDESQATLVLNEAPHGLDRAQGKGRDTRSGPTTGAQMPVSPTTPHMRADTHVLQDGAPAPPRSNRALLVGIVVISLLLLMLVGIGVKMLRRGSTWRERRNASNVKPEANNSNAELPPAPLKITATASSTRPPLRSNTYEAANVLDRNLGSAWLEGASGPGINEWIRCDFDREVKLRRINIAPGYFKSPESWARNNRVAAALLEFSDGSSREVRFPDRMEEQQVEVDGIRTSSVRVHIKEVYFGRDQDTAISQLAFETEP